MKERQLAIAAGQASRVNGRLRKLRGRRFPCIATLLPIRDGGLLVRLRISGMVDGAGESLVQHQLLIRGLRAETAPLEAAVPVLERFLLIQSEEVRDEGRGLPGGRRMLAV